MNWGGKLGAWLSDLSYFLFGYSVVWAYSAAFISWLTALIGKLHGEMTGNEMTSSESNSQDQEDESEQAWIGSNWAFWSGLALLMVSSCALEWSRLYRFDDLLPGHYAGGVLGYVSGSSGLKWLGFNGSGLIFVVFMIVGLSWAFRFSWFNVAEHLGAMMDDWLQARREQREIKEDLAMGQAAVKEREELAEVAHDREVEVEIVTPPKLIYEPEVLDVPKSKRVARERQKPLFADLPDSNLPQVDLLDSTPARLDSVSPETLEMTSRLI